MKQNEAREKQNRHQQQQQEQQQRQPQQRQERQQKQQTQKQQQTQEQHELRQHKQGEKRSVGRYVVFNGMLDFVLFLVFVFISPYASDRPFGIRSSPARRLRAHFCSFLTRASKR